MRKSIKVAQVSQECVACGSCIKVCPMDAIRIYAGIIAQINTKKCVGCGKCTKTCPADVITLTERGAAI